ncbi:MAG TPA: 4Fe-4S binding protein [Spirochaetota bacterium]|nr:4Fe-4S binding protein [Spirochaetota bacterium]HPC39597.1 4Fe-4S binding protein [Spirochaetota bacterium]HPL17737.1 4Fe-4S binding protein [Spirochaetota bacterium]HQF09492.1 4Fe-4S binding protein [Spirochaetota bacterium]HQH98175.1 4Fe-4S binding protein [Spirochaetota bacterium]
MQELVIISGKGGTGKTSMAASLAFLAKNKVIADCDVDAADMHLVLQPEVKQSTVFEVGLKASIGRDICKSCGECLRYCRFDAISDDFVVDPISCEGCGVCAHFCPHEAIEMKRHMSGKWFVSDTRHGPLVHAQLGIAEGNSGKLVTLIKKKAREIATEKGHELVIVDGSPGTGCPVIATVSGASLVLIVTEPTVSGMHDLRRVLELARHFNVRTAVCVNKADINPDNVAAIEAFCSNNGIPIAGAIPYDTDVTRAQIAGKSVVEHSNGQAARAIKTTWNTISEILSGTSQ